MDDKLYDIIQRGIWSVDQITLQANRLAEQAKLLKKDVKVATPAYDGDWSEESVQRFFETFKESIVNPIRHRNRDQLESLGITSKGIPDDVYDDSIYTQEVAKFSNEINIWSKDIFRLLIDKNILHEWIKVGLKDASERLKKIWETKSVFNQIIASSLGKELKEELIGKSMLDPKFLTTAEDTVYKLNVIRGYGVSTNQVTSADYAIKIATEICQKIVDIQGKFSIPKEELVRITENQSMGKADQLLSEAYKEYARKENLLLGEWELYSATLRSIGCPVRERPAGIQGLEDSVKALRIECTNALGESGIKILSYLKGSSDFPAEASLEDVKRSLGLLKPVFVRFLKEDGKNSTS